MSAVSSSPRVREVSAALVGAAAVGAVVIGRALWTLLRASSNAMIDEFNRGREHMSTNMFLQNHVLPIEVLRAECLRHEQNACGSLENEHLTPIENAQLTTLLSLAATPYVIDQPRLNSEVGALLTATTLADVGRAKADLLAAVEAGHQHVFVDSVVLACERAALQVGLSAVQVERVSGKGPARIIAADTTGRTLISEVRTDSRGRVSVDSEVLGVRDGSCHALLDAFDAALDRLGVRAEGRRRKSTGGACELALARDFLRRKVARRTSAAITSKTADQDTTTARRRQRLNAQARQRHG